MFLQPMKKEDIPPMTLMSMWNQVRNAATQGVQGGFAKVGETIQKTPLLKLGVNVLNAADYGLGTVAKTTEGLLTDRINTLKNLQYQPGEGLKSYANRNVTDISPYITQKVAGTQFGQKFPMVAPLIGLGAGMITPSPSDALKAGKFASQAGDVAKFSDDATELVKPKMLDPLASEAKKYKSAEEFVKAQGTPLYHGTYKIKGEEFTPKKALYLSNKEAAKTYGSGRVEEFFRTNGKTLKIDKEIIEPKEWDKIIVNARNNGYDFIEGNGTDFYGNKIPVVVAVNSEKSILTKSQLTDIWNKANQPTDLISEAKKYKSATQFRNALNINYRDSWAGDKDVNADQMLKLFGGKVFHGTNASKEIVAGGYKKGDYFNSGAYFSDTPERAIEYMKENRSRVGKNSNDVLINDLSNLKIKQGEGEIVREISKAYDGTEEYVNTLKKQGFDGIKDAFGETLVWNVEKIKKPETLTEIWNKAQEK